LEDCGKNNDINQAIERQAAVQMSRTQQGLFENLQAIQLDIPYLSSAPTKFVEEVCTSQEAFTCNRGNWGTVRTGVYTMEKSWRGFRPLIAQR